MAKYTGENLAVKFGATTLTANLVKSVEIAEKADAHESSGAGDPEKTYLAGKKDATVRMDAWMDDDKTAILDVFAPGTSATLVVYPNGNTSGKLSRSMTAIVVGRTLGVPHDGVAPLGVEFQVSGAITDANVA